jgi:hypothetical protein
MENLDMKIQEKENLNFEDSKLFGLELLIDF